MQRRNFLRLAAALPLTTLLQGCGSGWNLGFGPVRSGGNSGGGSGSVQGRIILLSGVSLEGMKVNTVLSEEAVNSSGSFKVIIQDNGPTLSVAQSKTGKLVLFGFTRTGRADISPRTTAEVLVFMATGAIYAPGVMQPVFIEQLSQPGILSATEKAISELIAAHGEDWMSRPSAALKAALIEDSRAFRPSVSRGSIVQPTDKVSGIIVESDGVGTTYLTNYFRRRAFYYVTRESYKDSTGATRASFQKIIDPGVSLSPIKGATNALVTIAEFAGGARDFLAPVKSDAIILPVAPSGATSTLYKVTAVGLGFFPGDFDKLDPQQQADWADTALRTLVIDFIIPLITGFVFPKMGEKIDKFLGDLTNTNGFVKDIITALAAQPDIITKAKAGNVSEATLDGFLILSGSESLKLALLQALWAALDLKDINLGIFMVNAFEKMNGLLTAVDMMLQVTDSAFQLLDTVRSQNATQWDVTITKPKLTLTPTTATVSVGQSTHFTAKVVDSDVAETLITYRWSLGGKGSLINPINSATGTTLDTSGGSVNFQAPATGITDNEKATLTVEAFVGGINDPNRRSLGTATAEVTLRAIQIYGEATVAYSVIKEPTDEFRRILRFMNGTYISQSPLLVVQSQVGSITYTEFSTSFRLPQVGSTRLESSISFRFLEPIQVGALKRKPDSSMNLNVSKTDGSTGFAILSSRQGIQDLAMSITSIERPESPASGNRVYYTLSGTYTDSEYIVAVTMSGWFLWSFE